MLELGWVTLSYTFILHPPADLFFQLQNRGYNDAPMHWHVSRASSWPIILPKDSTDAKPEGTCVPFVFDNKTGWVGFFIMNSPARGRGWGAALFREALEEFQRHGCEYVGLDAVAEQKKTYERRGFREVGMVRNMVRDGLGKSGMQGEVKIQGDGWDVVDIRSVGVESLVQCEERCTGFRRSRLWSKEGVFHRADDDAFGFAAQNKDGLNGLLLVRGCHLGFRFGPVYASTRDIATALSQAAMQKCSELNGDNMLAAEVSMENKGAVRLFEELGWKDAGVDYHRMWIDGKATPQLSKGGIGETHCWAIFDASEG